METVSGSSVADAESFYKNMKNKKRAKLILEIDNVSNWTLSHVQYRIVAGKTTTIPQTIKPGRKQAVSSRQRVSALKQYTEIVAAWHMSSIGYTCVIHARVEVKHIKRKLGNYFGVGCIATEQSLDEEKLLNNENPLNANKPFMNYSVTVSSHESQASCTEDSCALQDCNAYFCATIFGGVGNQLRVVFEILPKNSDNMVQTIEQSRLDILFRMTNCSEADSDLQTATFAYGGIGEGGLGFVVVGILILVVVPSCIWINLKYKLCIKRERFEELETAAKRMKMSTPQYPLTHKQLNFLKMFNMEPEGMRPDTTCSRW